MWWILVVALIVSLAVVAIVAMFGTHPQHAAPRRLAVVPSLEKWSPVGSMDLAAERALWTPPAYLLAAPVDPEPWRQRITAELSPEALGACPTCNPRTPGWITCVDYDGSGYDQACPDCTPADPGAGDVDVVSSAPAPDPDWLEAQMADLFAWVRHVHAGALA